MEIEKIYQPLVKDLTAACKSLGWKFSAEMDIDNLINLRFDDCNYFVSPTAASTEQTPQYCIGVMVHRPGNFYEPPSADDVEIPGRFESPRQAMTTLLNAHWQQRLNWALESTDTEEHP